MKQHEKDDSKNLRELPLKKRFSAYLDIFSLVGDFSQTVAKYKENHRQNDPHDREDACCLQNFFTLICGKIRGQKKSSELAEVAAAEAADEHRDNAPPVTESDPAD